MTCCDVHKFCDVYLGTIKLLCLETITFSNAMLSDINVVCCYVLSQYRLHLSFYILRGSCGGAVNVYCTIYSIQC